MTADAGPDSPILQQVELGTQWPTADPFLFCAHHLDHYPAGTAEGAPATGVAGRAIGQDFSGKDGWNMYHGSKVPGFPQHPHRGFETVTFVRQGFVDHADSLGATARFGRGDTQWLTAGGGVVHSEMFPLVNDSGPNPLHLFQIWLNLPAQDKMVDPYFTMLWAEDIPTRRLTDQNGAAVEVAVIAGELDGLAPLAPPPNSWAARPEADVAIWHLDLEPGARWTVPAAHGPDTVRTLYCFEGDGLTIDGAHLGAEMGAVIDCTSPHEVRAGTKRAEALILQGRAIGEPIARYGPFVMNTEAEIQQAFGDYQRTQFGGWPWPDDAPDHGRGSGRFAIHADGRRESR